MVTAETPKRVLSSAVDARPSSSMSCAISLNTAKHPEISFRSTLIAGDATAATVTGDLTIAGSTRPVQLRLTAHPDADRVTGAASIVQTNHGIKPYSAMFGTLKVKDLAPPDEGSGRHEDRPNSKGHASRRPSRPPMAIDMALPFAM